MWNNHQALNLLSRLLITSVVIATLYVISIRLTKPPFFPLQSINIHAVKDAKTGHDELLNVTRDQIAHITKNEIKGNFLSVNLTEVREAFVKLPWVRDARVTRQWPDGLDVVLEEHHALAYWGSHALVNTYGEVFRVTVNRELPIFTGPTEASAKEVTRNYRRFSQILLPLHQSITDITLTPRYAWRIRLNTGTLLELGRDEIEDRLTRYVAVYDHSIARFNQERPLAYVDLRHPNGFAIRTPEVMQHVPRKSGSKRET